jgi:hypothetical protein
MAQFRVVFLTSVEVEVLVEADDEDRAEDAALESARSTLSAGEVRDGFGVRLLNTGLDGIAADRVEEVD